MAFIRSGAPNTVDKRETAAGSSDSIYPQITQISSNGYARSAFESASSCGVDSFAQAHSAKNERSPPYPDGRVYRYPPTGVQRALCCAASAASIAFGSSTRLRNSTTPVLLGAWITGRSASSGGSPAGLALRASR